MYAAYQSGQFSSLLPSLASCAPWACSARRNALARSLTDANVVVAGSIDLPALRDLLEQPAVAVRITERGERAVAAVLRIGTADPDTSEQIGFVRAGVRAAAVERLADLDAATDQLFAGGLEVGDDQVQALGGAGCGRGDVLAEVTEHAEPGGVNWSTRKSLPSAKSGVEPPPEVCVKLLRAVDIRDGDYDDLELHVGVRVHRGLLSRDQCVGRG